MRVLAVDPVEELFRTQHERLWKSLLAFSGDPEVATEAEAEAFTQTVARGDELRDPAAWLWRAAFKIAGGLLADKRSRPQRGSSLDDVDGGADPTAYVEDQSALADFLDLLDTLSTQQRAIVVLRYAGGFKPTEIAELLGTTSGSVRVQLHRSHQHLRERITRNGHQ